MCLDTRVGTTDRPEGEQDGWWQAEAGQNNPRSGKARQRDQHGPVGGCVDGGSAEHPSLVVGGRRDCVDIFAANTSADPLWTGLGRVTSRVSGLESAVAEDSGGTLPGPELSTAEVNQPCVEYIAHGVAPWSMCPGGYVSGKLAVVQYFGRAVSCGSHSSVFRS